MRMMIVSTGLSDIRLAHRTLEEQTCEYVNMGERHAVITYQLLPLYEPLVHFFHMKYVPARQLSNPVSLDEHFQTDRAFILLVHPLGLFFVISYHRLHIHRRRLTSLQVAVEIREIRGFRICGVGGHGSMFLPSCPGPNPPWKAVNDFFWRTVPLSGSCCTNTMNQ